METDADGSGEHIDLSPGDVDPAGDADSAKATARGDGSAIGIVDSSDASLPVDAIIGLEGREEALDSGEQEASVAPDTVLPSTVDDSSRSGAVYESVFPSAVPSKSSDHVRSLGGMAGSASTISRELISSEVASGAVEGSRVPSFVELVSRVGFLSYLWLFLLLVGAALFVRAIGRRFVDGGVVPRVLSSFQTVLRLLAVVFAVLFAAGRVPSRYFDVLMWVLLAVAVAVGWSMRELLPDFFAGVVLFVERRIRAGVFVSGAGYCGRVISVGVRASKLQSCEGAEVLVPNRSLIGRVVVDESVHPLSEIVLRVPGVVEFERMRRTILDLALASPWRDLDGAPEVFVDGADSRIWRVRVRLMDHRYRKAFESALVGQLCG